MTITHYLPPKMMYGAPLGEPLVALQAMHRPRLVVPQPPTDAAIEARLQACANVVQCDHAAGQPIDPSFAASLAQLSGERVPNRPTWSDCAHAIRRSLAH